MFNLHQLPKTTKRAHKRQGQGYGSGKGGHTSGRGQKGQRTRGGIPLWFEGGQLPQIRRFPFIRGKNRFESLHAETVAINLSALNRLAPDSVVNPKLLYEAGLIGRSDLKKGTIRILGRGEITIPLTIEVYASKQAAQKIEAAGGKVNRELNT